MAEIGGQRRFAVHGDTVLRLGMSYRGAAERGNRGGEAEEHSAHHPKDLLVAAARIESPATFSMPARTFAKLAADRVSRWIPSFMQCNRRAQVILLPHLGNNEHRNAPLLRAKESERKLTP
jgi:hypothetical protein